MSKKHDTSSKKAMSSDDESASGSKTDKTYICSSKSRLDTKSKGSHEIPYIHSKAVTRASSRQKIKMQSKESMKILKIFPSEKAGKVNQTVKSICFPKGELNVIILDTF